MIGMEDLRKKMSSDEYDIRMAAAKKRAEWELGDSSWAGIIVGAFLYPEDDRRALDAEQALDHG